MARRRRSAGVVDAETAITEAFRILRSNLLVAMADLDNPVVLVTSAQTGEGKSSTCAGLAASLATAGRRVVAVDLDLRHPDLHRRFGGHDELGATDVLLDRRSLQDCLQWIELDGSGGSEATGRGLYLLATGPAVANPTELLATSRTQRLLRALSDQADIVLIDTPPVLPVADTLVIGRSAAGAILVVASRLTEVGSANRAKDALARNQTRLLGVVLNRLDDDLSPGHGYGYGYTPGSNGSSPTAAEPE